MTYDTVRHHRRSIRLKGYDYTQPGAYFVTVVTRDRVCLFGDVVDGEMRLNEYGEIVRAEWFKTADLRPYVRLTENEFVVMPNHIHGIIWITDHVGARRRRAPTSFTSYRRAPTSLASYRRAPTSLASYRRAPASWTSSRRAPACAPTGRDPTPAIEQFGKPVCDSIPTIVRAFKSAVTNRINDRRGTPGAPVWQRNYFEHIIRNEESLRRIHGYIVNNPMQWAMDRENPEAGEPILGQPRGGAPTGDGSWRI